ncbi:MAG: right-handed parallel beta-helix repeat-containing protein [Lysobacterales bacterium]
MKRILLLALSFGCSSGYSADGVLELNQACASVGCFPGDVAGLPIEITYSGSYRLTSNLSAPSTDGIRISANAVELDLGGFTISGPVSCSGSPLVCVPASYGPGGIVVTPTTAGVVVRNGQIQGFGGGIFSGQSGLIESVTSQSNAEKGIVARSGTVVRNVSALFNAGAGIEVFLGGQVVDSVANFNGSFGVTTGGVPNNGGATIRNSSMFGNAGHGIYDWGRSIIDGCNVNGNSGPGIRVDNGGSRITNNVVAGNQLGIQILDGRAFEPTGSVTALSGNVLTGNNGGSANPQITGSGQKVYVGQNICGSVICN